MVRNEWPRPALLDAQQRHLRATLRHAVAHSPYYREVLGPVAAADASLDDMPILTKAALMEQWGRIATDPRLALDDVEEHLAGERAGELWLGEYRVCATGGTTGERAVVVYDQEAWAIIVANMLRWVQLVGAGPETRVVGIGAPTPLHITNRAFAELRAGRAGSPRLSVVTPLPDVIDALNAYRPEVIVTYPSFARRLLEEQSAGPLRIQPRAIVSTAEVLAPDIRAMARATWGAEVHDSYGTTEGGLLGAECTAGAGVHLAEDLVILEVVDEGNRAVPAGTAGAKVLLTVLFNRALPLIRYEISDVVTVAAGAGACGHPYGRVATIDGRREDYLRLQGRIGGHVRVHAGRLRQPLCRIPGLRQFQVVPAGDELRLRVAVRTGIPVAPVAAAAARAVAEVLADAGVAVGTVPVEVVDRIEPAGSAAKEKLVGV